MQGYKVACGADLPHIAEVLSGTDAHTVMVRDINSVEDLFPLIDITVGPFTCDIQFGHWNLAGRDKQTGERKAVRILPNGTVELRKENSLCWIQPGFGATRIYIPE